MASSSHAFSLAKYLYNYLTTCCHGKGKPVAKVYCDNKFISMETQGPIVAFNLLNPDGSYIGFAKVLISIYLWFWDTGFTKYQAVKLSPGGSFTPPVPYMRGAGNAWCRIRMAPYTHGAVYASRCIRMAPYNHGTVYTWCCIRMALYTHGAVYVALYTHGTTTFVGKFRGTHHLCWAKACSPHSQLTPLTPNQR